MKLNINIDDDLHQRMKVKAAREGRSLTRITAELYEWYLAGPQVKAEQHWDLEAKGPVELLEVAVVEKVTPGHPGRITDADAQSHQRTPTTDRTDPRTRTVKPGSLSKEAQARGRMGRR